MKYTISLKYRGQYKNVVKEFETREGFEEFYDECIANGRKVIGVFPKEEPELN